ncbi:polycystin-1-like protein 2 isoform X2 [Tubulanus polymorphus]|uniref:polycystin-1-like protein 2 isoform X2 n=1 Tax=Tubulanus polymorphus TaxID=672921 RepID=UPI003DA26A4E
MVDQSTILNTNTLLYTNLTEPITARYFRVYPQSFNSRPSIRIGLQGCGQIRETRTFTHTYTSTGSYNVTLTASNLISDVFGLAEVRVQQPLQDVSVYFPDVIGHSFSGFVVFSAAAGTDIVAEATLMNRTLTKIDYNSTRSGNIEISRPDYGGIGPYNCNATISNYITNPQIFTRVIIIDFIILNPVVSPQQKYINKTSKVVFVVTMDFGSQVNISFDYADAGVTNLTTGLSFVANKTHVTEHVFNDVGMFYVNVTMVNKLSSAVLISTIGVQNPISSLELSTNDPVTMTAGVGQAVLTVRYSGDASNIPTNVTCYFAYGDGSPDEEKSLILNSNQFVVNHPYTNASTYDVTVTLLNEVSSTVLTASIDTDEPITGARLEVDKQYYRVGERVQLRIYFDTGTRVNLTVLWSDGTQSNTLITTGNNVTLSHVYNEVLSSSAINATLSNSLGVTFISLPHTLDTEHPITNAVLTGLSAIEFPINGPSKTVYIDLLLTSGTPLPSNVVWSINWGDGNTDPSQPFSCIASGVITGNTTHTKCISLPGHDYQREGPYDVTVNISNHVSNEVLNFRTTLYKAITALAIEVFYIDASGDNRTGHGPNKNLYPLENTILFKVTHSTGNNLVYTWEFGDDTRQSLDEISAITHNYSLINSYTVNMTASDPLHAESTSINIVLINRAGKIEFFIENPMPRNFTYPIELVVDSVGTDVCYQIDCVAENATLGRFLYFASAMTICRSQFPADSIDGENFKTVSDADLRASGKIGFYNIFHKVAFYTIAATARNYVSNETTENPLTVTKGPCFFPRVDLRNPNRCADAKMCTSSTLNTGVKTHYKSEDLLVLSDVRYNCTTTSIGHFTWRAEGIDRNSGLWVNVTDQLEARNVSLYTDTAAPLFIPKRALDYGLYRFILNVSMDNETGIWKEGHVEIKIVASPLAGGINGGPYQRIPFASDFNFTATDLTYDPDLDPDYWNDGVMIRWFCKMQCEDWPTFDSGYRNTENITTNRCKRIERKRNRGCFSQESVPGAPYAGELRRDYSNPLKPFEIINNNLWLNTSFLFEKSYIDIFMVAVKGNRQVRYNQSVYVMLGKPPIVGLSCVTNCFEDKSEMITKLNPVSRFSVRSVVKGRVGGINYIYGWDLLHYDADFSYLYADNFTIPRSLWSDKASTGLVGADLSLNENYFIAEDYNRYFMLRLNCYREGAEEANALIYYPLMINAPPNVDNTTCTVTPENGTALETRFNMECSGMYDVDLPLKFEFGYSSTGSLTDISWFDANQDPQFSRRSIFPSGFENNGFNLTLYLKTIDGANSFTQIEVAKIKVYPPKTNLEEMNLMLANPNANPAAGLPPQAAAQVWMAFASQVNQEEDTPPVTGNDTNQNSEAERQLNMKKQFRETAASNLASVPVRADLESVKVIGQAASAIVGKPNEVTESALNDIQNICENLDTALQGLADNPSVGAEQVEQACTEQVKLMSNVFDAQSALTEKTGTTEKAAKEATSRMQGLLSGVSSSVLKKKVMGEAPTIITSPSVTMFMKKDSPAAFLNQTLDVGQGHSCAGMKFADNKNMFGNENETAFSLSSQASTVASNPYVWSPEASKVSSPVTSLSMIDDSGHSLNMSNLPDDIEIWIDAGKDQKPVPPVLGWTISDDLLMNTFSVNVSDYGALSVNISQFLNVTTFTRNVTDAYGNVTQEEYDVDYSVNTTYPNQTVRFAIYLRRESQPTTGIYNDLCILPVASRQTRVSNSSENDVNSTGRNIDTDRCAQKRPKSPSLTTCFWDHEQLNITDEKVLFYIGVRAFLDNLTHEVTTENINDQDFVVTQLSSEIYTMSCRYWSDEDDRWSSEGCRVGNRSNIQATQCFCNHLTSFASMFVVPMNVPNFADLSSLSPSELAKNPVALAFMCSIFGVYLLAVIWARWMDGLDKLKVGATPLASNNPRDKYMYEITVYTGFAKNAGTTARVSFILVGDDRESEPRLFEDNKRKIFQAGQTNTFVMATSSTLGQLSHIRVWHDNSGKKPAWFFSRMMIEDIQTGDKFYFICDRWLAVEEDDGQIDRVIPVAGSDELTSFNHLFALKARKNLTDDHLWFSVITRPPRSKFTRVQRLTSILSLLFTSMMASIMFFGNESDVQNPTMIELGPIKFSLHSIYIGVISGLVVVPINIVIVIMFRSVKPCPYSFGGCWAGFRRKCCRKKSPASPSLDSKSLLSSAASEADFKIALEKSHEQIALEGLDEKGVFIINPSMTNYGGGLQPGYPVQPLGMKKEPVKPKKKKFQLPWWMLIFTYMLTFGTIAFSFMWVVLTAGQILGKKGAIEFVSSFSTSVVQSIFLTQPVKIILVASIYALVIRKPEKEEDDDEDDAKIIERENPHLANDEEFVHVIADIPKRVYYPPPDGHQLAAAREERLKELKMNKVIKEVSLYVFFVVLLMFVIYVERGPAGFYQNHSVKNVIELGVYAANSTNGDTTMSAVVSHEKFWYYMFHSFVPSIYSVLWHQGRRVNSKPGQKFIADDQNWMINAPRLRQLRLSPEKSCEIKNKLKALISECRDSYNMFDQEERQFKIGWKPINKSDSSDKPDVSWSYRTAIDLAGYPTSGVIATYSGGGYVADLGTTADQAYSNIQTLYDNSWIDRYTRAVFVEFVLINPNTNLYTTSAVIFEFISVGGIVPRPMFHTLRLGMVTGPSLYAVVALQILVAIFMIYYMVNEIKVMCKIKRPYFKEYFNILELLLVIFYIVVIVLYFVRFAASKIITNQVNKNKHRYVNFQYIVLMEETYTYICAFVAFFSTIKILKLLRFNKKVSMLSSVIRNSVKPIFNFLIMFSIVFFAFVQLALLLFSADLSGFKSTVRTMETLFVMLLNKFDYKSFEKGSPVFGPVFFFFFTVLVTFVLMNFFISVIMESYYVVKQDLLKQSNEYEIVDYIMKRFKTFVGKTGPGRRTANMTSGDNNEYTYEHYVEGNDNFEEFEERIEKLLTFLDNYINPPVDVDKADVLLQETEYTSMRKCKSDHLKPNETVQK